MVCDLKDWIHTFGQLLLTHQMGTNCHTFVKMKIPTQQLK